MTTQEAFDWIMNTPDAREAWARYTAEAREARPGNPAPYLTNRVYAAWGCYAVESDKLARLLLLHFDRDTRTLV